MHGRHIVIDGGEGSGKGTVRRVLKGIFRSPYTIYSREPGGTAYAEKIRKVILCEEAKDASANTLLPLFLAARSDHTEKKIRPALQTGINVVTDRFDASSFAYQIWAQEGFHLRDMFDRWHQLVCWDVRPYLYIYLDVDPEIGMARTKNRGEQNHLDRRKIDFHRKVRQGYLEFISTRPHRIVDANRDDPRAVIRDCLEIAHQALD